MFGIGETELVIIIIFAFMLFGPDKLPGMGRTIGKALRQFREAQEGFTSVVQAEVVDPMTDAMAMGESGKKKPRAAQPDAIDDDADLEGGEGKAASKGETFAERKARLKAEREAREAAEREAATAVVADVDDADASDADAATEASVQAEATPATAEEKAPKETSAAALYAMAPRKRVKETEETVPEAAPEAEAERFT